MPPKRPTDLNNPTETQSLKQDLIDRMELLEKNIQETIKPIADMAKENKQNIELNRSRITRIQVILGIACGLFIGLGVFNWKAIVALF